MKELTKAQEEILKALWAIDEGATADIIKQIKIPKPAYTTVATVIKVLEKKGFVTHRTFGNVNVFRPLISKKEYGQYKLLDTFKGLFNSSLKQMMSTFVRDKNISIEELEELKLMLETEIEKENKKK